MGGARPSAATSLLDVRLLCNPVCLPGAEKQRAFLAWYADPESDASPSVLWPMRFGNKQKAAYAGAVLAGTETGKVYASMQGGERNRHRSALKAAAAELLSDVLAAAKQD